MALRSGTFRCGMVWDCTVVEGACSAPGSVRGGMVRYGTLRYLPLHYATVVCDAFGTFRYGTVVSFISCDTVWLAFAVDKLFL